MEICVNTKYAFLVTFMWYASYVIWLVMITTTLMIPVSNAIFGTDTTSTWSLFGLNSTQTLGIISVGLILLVTWCSTRGMDKIKKFADIGGISSIVIIAVLVVGSLAVLIGNHVRDILDKADVAYQFAELGKVDLGGGGTIAFIMAKYGMMQMIERDKTITAITRAAFQKQVYVDVATMR